MNGSHGTTRKTPNGTAPHEVQDDIESLSENSKHLKSKRSDILDLNGASHSNGSSSDPHASGLSAVALKAVTACVLYSFCSVSMILTNKSLASRCVTLP